MSTSQQEYQQQIQKAKETVAKLEYDLQLIRNKLLKQPNCSVYMQELKNITLDMKITLNELEHSQSFLDDDCEDIGFCGEFSPIC